LGVSADGMRETLLSMASADPAISEEVVAPLFPVAPPVADLEGDVLGRESAEPRCPACRRVAVDAVRHLRVPVDIEVTVECNPDDATEALLATWRGAGVTRVSLGVQSLDPAVLAGLGRRHDPEAVLRAVALVRAAGFPTWSLDLITGGAGEDHGSWQRTLDGVLALDPPHVSAYCLTVEPGTPLAADPSRHPDEDEQADRYLRADEVLSRSGRPWYEISSWAKPGHQCRHNRLYWEQGDYRGLGCAAHSHAAGRRWWNVRTPERYCEIVEAGQDPVGGEELLDPAARAEEALQLSLRTSRGVPASALDTEDPALGGLVRPDGNRLVLTPRGRLLTSEVSLRLRLPTPA